MSQWKYRYLPPQPQRQEYLPYRVFLLVSCGGVLVGYLEVVLTMWAAGLRTPGVRVERDTRTVTGGVVAASLHTSMLRILVAWCKLSMLLLDTSREVK